MLYLSQWQQLTVDTEMIHDNTTKTTKNIKQKITLNEVANEVYVVEGRKVLRFALPNRKSCQLVGNWFMSN